MKNVYMLLLALSLASFSPRPRQPWRGFAGPAYLPAPLPRRPKQAVLDARACAASQLLAIPPRETASH
ncbi:hypothetical protein [Hymenobacter baengnokdamensis]|uniref:hypothetical protein n=1 Tax=Hymenobacter baengnokdamensis TaxID=2615203 RepID=UPI0012451539|nr:hypothetical protein [Hymenobacter baengnokdamensis]